MAIDGLKIYVSGKELSELTKKRAEYHHEKSKYYTSKVASLLRSKAGTLEKLTYGDDDPDEELSHFSAQKVEPDSSRYERKAREHVEREIYFSFLASHFKTTEEYILDENDLRSLEILKIGY